MWPRQLKTLVYSLGFLLLAGGGLLLPAGIAESAMPALVDGRPLPSLAPLLERSTPAVVNVFTKSTVTVRRNPLFEDPFFKRFFDIPDQPRQRQTQNLGSGVIVDAGKGYVLTNNHVIEGADEIQITLSDGRSLDAKLLGRDPDSDIAVLKVAPDRLTALPMSNSDDLRVGDFVVAIGNPFGLGQTVTSGIVSALGRSGLGIGTFEDYIQTDASINPGNSGGALINLRGELIGINTAIYSRSGGNIGIGFAIPTNMAKDIMQQLIEFGVVQRGRLGAQAQDLTPELAQAFNIQGQPSGAVVVKVSKDSPADLAGLKLGDVVTAMNGRPVRKAEDLRNGIGLLRVGTRVTLEILRNGSSRTLVALVSKTAVSELAGEELHPRLSGAVLTDMAEGSPLYGKVEGIEVSQVKRGTAAASAGLRKGDIITSINRQNISDIASARELLQEKGNQLLLNIQRGNSAMFLLLR